jgi:hypothetical protein
VILLALLACQATVEDAGPRPDLFDDTDAPAAPLALSINEIMPKNTSSWTDEAGQHPDWIELYNPHDEDVPLDGWSMADTEDSADAEPLSDGLVVPAGGWLLLTADGEPSRGPNHLPFSLSGDGEAVALYAPDGSGSVVTYDVVIDDIAIARIPDGCTGEGCWQHVYGGTPGYSNSGEPVGHDEIVVPRGSVWRYRDDGAAPADWASPAFSDAAWPSGAAPLGYGDAHVVTTTSYGPDDQNKRITTYFRAGFTLEAAATDAKIRLLVDDGAAVYLDGVELFRDNLPAGALTADTLASSAVGDAAETDYAAYEVGAIDAGAHVLAVEVHQSSPASSDLGFDLELEVTLP